MTAFNGVSGVGEWDGMIAAIFSFLVKQRAQTLLSNAPREG